MSKIYINDGTGNREATQEEIDAIYSPQWNKDVHIAEINRLHLAEFDRRWMALKYEGRWEVSDASKDNTLEHHEEAKELMKYWNDGWKAIITYAEIVTEETAQDPIAFTLSI